MQEENQKKEASEPELKSPGYQRKPAILPSPETREERLGVWDDEPKLH